MAERNKGERGLERGANEHRCRSGIQVLMRYSAWCPLVRSRKGPQTEIYKNANEQMSRIVGVVLVGENTYFSCLKGFFQYASQQTKGLKEANQAEGIDRNERNWWFFRLKQRKPKPQRRNWPFSFFQRSVDRTENDLWFNKCWKQQASIKEALGISPATTLNIYTCQFSSLTMIGYATLPWEDSESSLHHAVAIHHGTLPGGGMVTLNLGDNAVHEVIFYWTFKVLNIRLQM